MSSKVARLVRLSLAFHNLNKSAESQIGLSLVQYHVLETLRDRPGCSPQILAEAAGMHPSTLTQTLKRLQRKGVLYVCDDPKDARRKILTLNRRGQDLLIRFTREIGSLLERKRATP